MQIVCSNHKRCSSSFFVCYLFICFLFIGVIFVAGRISMFVPEKAILQKIETVGWPHPSSCCAESQTNLFCPSSSLELNPLQSFLKDVLSYEGKRVRPLGPELWEFSISGEKVSLAMGESLALQWREGFGGGFFVSSEVEGDVRLVVAEETLDRGVLVNVFPKQEDVTLVGQELASFSLVFELPEQEKSGGRLEDCSLQGMVFLGENVFLKECSTSHNGRIALLSLPVESVPGSCAGSVCLHVRAGDWLAATAEGWSIFPRDQVQEQKGPLVHVLGYDSNGIHLQVWESAQDSRQDLTLVRAGGEKEFGKSFVCSRVASYGQSGASIFLGKQCFVLRPGDWLVQVGDHWKQIFSVREMDAFLSWDLVGELFVFLGIEDQCVIGHLFDETRTQKKLIREQVKS